MLRNGEHDRKIFCILSTGGILLLFYFALKFNKTHAFQTGSISHFVRKDRVHKQRYGKLYGNLNFTEYISIRAISFISSNEGKLLRNTVPSIKQNPIRDVVFVDVSKNLMESDYFPCVIEALSSSGFRCHCVSVGGRQEIKEEGGAIKYKRQRSEGKTFQVGRNGNYVESLSCCLQESLEWIQSSNTGSFYPVLVGDGIGGMVIQHYLGSPSAKPHSILTPSGPIEVQKTDTPVLLQAVALSNTAALNGIPPLAHLSLGNFFWSLFTTNSARQPLRWCWAITINPWGEEQAFLATQKIDESSKKVEKEAIFLSRKMKDRILVMGSKKNLWCGEIQLEELSNRYSAGSVIYFYECVRENAWYASDNWEEGVDILTDWLSGLKLFNYI